MKLVSGIKYLAILLLTSLIFLPGKTKAQYNNNWITAGAFQDWYSEIGCEIEEGFVRQQQYGGQWPAIYPNQDSKASRGFWIGAANFTDEKGTTWANKVVHIGPRVSGSGEFFPQTFKLISKFSLPSIFVDNKSSFNNIARIDSVDPAIKPDMEIVNVVNNQLGLTMTRKIYQFSQPQNDNYMIYDFTFTNTGNTNNDTVIELPNNTLTGVYFYWLYRNASNAESRFEIGNATGWGVNTMINARGDGQQNIAQYNDPLDERFRAQWSYHGHYMPFTMYDNIGGPLWNMAPYIQKGDTVGRLSAIQFYGIVTLHADKSAEDTADDVNQPSTTNYIMSDDNNLSNNDASNPVKMNAEYGIMSGGHKPQRHVWAVQPDGKFDEPTGDPSLGTPGGYSFANGYGPYTIKPGQSIHIVMAECIAGLSREAATRIGIAYKWGLISAKAKNDSVLTGQDSLFQTFRRAMTNYSSGYNILEPPLPPSTFNVNSGSDRISLSWNVFQANESNLKGFNIYRATGRYDSSYTLIKQTGASDRSFDDSSTIKGLSYYYYITSVGNNGLESNKYFTQTYNPAVTTITGLTDDINIIKNYSLFQNYPNPFNPSTSIKYGIPKSSYVKVCVYNLLGQMVSTLVNRVQNAGYYNTDWNAINAPSGIYFYTIYSRPLDGSKEFRDVKKMILLK